MKINLGVGETKPVTVSGAQFYYMSGLGRIEVKIVAGGNARTFELSPGMGFRNDDSDLPFYGVEIRNLHSDAQQIEFEISYRQVFDNRVSFSDVSVDVDEVRLGKTVRKSAFVVSQRSGVAPAGRYSAVSLRNPAGSGKNVVVRKAVFSGNVTEHVLLSTAQSAVDYANAAVAGLSLGAANNVNKLINGQYAPSVVTVDRFTLSTLAFGQVRSLMHFFNGSTSPVVYEFSEPIVLGPDAALFMSTWTPVEDLLASFEFVEVAI